MSATGTRVELDVAALGVSAVNRRLQEPGDDTRFHVRDPAGRHNLAVGLTEPVDVEIAGHVGYYCAGGNEQARIAVAGSCGPAVAENMMSGRVDVSGDASQWAGATAHGGLLVIRGDASSRCAISLKGADVVVGGCVGHMAAFMAQSGRLVVCGDVGEALGDSLYEAQLYVRGTVASLGADCIEKPLRVEHRAALAALLADAGVEADARAFRRYGSARRLYHFEADRVDG